MCHSTWYDDLMTPQQWPLFFGERQSDPVRFLCGNFSKISAMAFYTFKHRISCSWSMMTPLFAKRHFCVARFFFHSSPGSGEIRCQVFISYWCVQETNPFVLNIAINNTTVEKNKPQMICQWSYVVITHGMLEIPPFCPMNFPFKWPWKWWIFQPCLMTQHDAWTGLLSLNYPHWLVPESWIVMVHIAVFVCLKMENNMVNTGD